MKVTIMLRRTLLLGAAAMLAGCAVTGQSAGSLNPNYVKGSVKSIVMLPVLNPSVAAVYQPALQSELALSLQQKNLQLRFMATNEALTRLMTGDAAGESRSLVAAVYGKTPVNADDLKKVHNVLGVDAAVICGFEKSGSDIDMPVYILDLRSGQTIWSGVAKGWQPASAVKGKFAASLGKAMEEGLVDLHKKLPAL